MAVRPTSALRARLRRFAARHRVLYTLAVGLAALMTFLVVADALPGEDASSTGSRSVLVARHPIEAGAVLSERDVRVVRRPAADVPEEAGPRLPVGRAAVALMEGQVLTPALVIGASPSPLAATVPEGHRGMSVGRGAAALPVEVGDLVDVIVVADRTTSDVLRSVTAARAVPVVAVAEQTVTVAVPIDEVAGVAVAEVWGTVVLTLVGR